MAINVATCLSAIADATSVPLHYSSGVLSGSLKACFEPLPYLSLPVRVQAYKVFASEQVGVLFYVMGDLYMLVAFMPSTQVLSAYLVDSSKVPGTSRVSIPDVAGYISKSMSLAQAVQALRPAIVASFLYREKKWSTLKLPA